jgi:hypothetical protein
MNEFLKRTRKGFKILHLLGQKSWRIRLDPPGFLTGINSGKPIRDE